ncbi:cell wall-binding protein [Bacillus cytotoxicus]|uniref:Cell wall-binding protein n=1 Tax=Bacillus cytotoxicus TaxID=580165 RepID=A0ACC6A5H0_9BACI|nr:cell wall-binding protein [Bacillus cytotoxicus]
MNGKETKRGKKILSVGIGKKVIPATAALGILFAMAPVGENKASAGIGAVVDIGITVLGAVANTYEALGVTPGDPAKGTHIDVYSENETYQAPSFTSGEFNISMYHTQGDSNFVKQVKVRYPNGRIENHQLKSGQQLKITDAGAIIDLNPNAANISEHDLLYITQAQLDEGKTGVAINQGQYAFVEKTSGKNPRFLGPLYKKYAGVWTPDWDVIVYNQDTLFNHIANKLSDEQKRLITLTSKPVSKEVLDNYVTNDPKARADFYDRLSDVLAERTNVIETGLVLDYIRLNDGKPYQIIPYKKGTNKVIVKTGSKYLSGKEGNELQYSDSLGDDEVFELVQVENNGSGSAQFRLNNKNGVSLVGDRNTSKFGTGEGFSSEIRFDDRNNNEIHNWLVEWYPGKENERQKYDGAQFVADEKDSTKLIAKDSSGNVIKNSWVNKDSKYHFADAEGALLKGWQDIKGKTYYFDPSTGELVTARHKGNDRIEGKFYTFDDSGALQRSVWSKSGYDGRSYSDASGALIEKGLQEIDGKIYYFEGTVVHKGELRLEDQNVILHFSDKGVLERVSNLNGKVIDSAINVKFDNKILAFNKDGSIVKTGINKNEKTLVYYSLEDGISYTGWKMIDGKNYYFTNGINDTFNDYKDIDGKRYYIHEDGSAKRAGFEKIDGKIYHFDNDGVAQTGWQTIDGKYYYFDEKGAAKTGWFQVGGGYRPIPLAYGYLWYCAREDGSLYADAWFKIDGKDYHFDQWGHKMPY